MTETKKAAAAAPVPAVAPRASFADAIAAAIAAAQTVAVPCLREPLAQKLSDSDLAAIRAMGWISRPIGAPSGQRGLMAPRGRGADTRLPAWPDFAEIGSSVAGMRRLFAACVTAAAVESLQAREATGKHGGLVWVADCAKVAYAMELDFGTVETLQRFLVAELSAKVDRVKGFFGFPQLPEQQFPQFLILWNQGIEQFNNDYAAGNIIEPEPQQAESRRDSVSVSYF